MALHVNLIAERGVEREFIDAAAASALQLADAMGMSQEPQYDLHTIEESVLAVNRKGQVDAAVLDTITPFTLGGLSMLIVSRDLGVGDTYPRPLNFVYGVSTMAKGNLVVSTHRMQSVGMFQTLTLHEAGHAVGLVTDTAPNYDRVSSFAGHCVKRCIMRPGNNISDMQKLTRDAHVHGPFCGDCSGYLRSRVRR